MKNAHRVRNMSEESIIHVLSSVIEYLGQYFSILIYSTTSPLQITRVSTSQNTVRNLKSRAVLCYIESILCVDLF